MRIIEGVAPRVVGGQASPTTQDSVVYLALNGGYCTGTLISPNLVLTARHCVSQVSSDNGSCGTFVQDIDPSNLSIAIGASANGNSQKAGHAVAIFHEASSDVCGGDIALVQLAADVPGASTSPVRFSPVNPGDSGFMVVGYGKIDDHGSKPTGRLERGGLVVDHVGAVTYDYTTTQSQTIEVQIEGGELTTGEATCNGDDGAPLFDASGSIVALDSRRVDNNCQDRPTIWTAISAHPSLILDAAQTAGHPVSVTTTSQTGADGGAATDAAAPSAPRTSNPGNAAEAGIDDSSDDDGNTDYLDPNQGAQPTSKSSCAAAPIASANATEPGVALTGLGFCALLLRRRRRA